MSNRGDALNNSVSCLKIGYVKIVLINILHLGRQRNRTVLKFYFLYKEINILTITYSILQEFIKQSQFTCPENENLSADQMSTNIKYKFLKKDYLVSRLFLVNETLVVLILHVIVVPDIIKLYTKSLYDPLIGNFINIFSKQFFRHDIQRNWEKDTSNLLLSVKEVDITRKVIEFTVLVNNEFFHLFYDCLDCILLFFKFCITLLTKFIFIVLLPLKSS